MYKEGIFPFSAKPLFEYLIKTYLHKYLLRSFTVDFHDLYLKGTEMIKKNKGEVIIGTIKLIE